MTEPKPQDNLNAVMPSDLDGKIGICSNGIKGRIAGRCVLPWGLSYVGVRLDNGEPWASRNPKIVDEAKP